jgi:glycosyltransferase involved in cell wall biosynthesis
MDNLTLLIPAKDEAESLPLVLDELKPYGLKILVVMAKDDIETKNAISNYNVQILFQKIKGYGAAIIEGINHIETDYLCIFNADGSFRPTELKEMYYKTKKNDFIFGTRYETGCSSDDDTFLTFIGNFIFTNLGKFLFKLKVTDILYTFIMGNSKNFKNLKLKQKDFTICTEIPINIQKIKNTYNNNKSNERSRLKGKKKVNEIIDGSKILFYMIYRFFK